MSNNVKTYDGTGNPEDHVKIFQVITQVERWAMPTWCHMLNSTLIGTARVWFDELSLESIDGYTNLNAAFLAYFMQQKKYVKDSVEIHNIKQKDEETIEEFMKRFKIKTGHMKGDPECMSQPRNERGSNKFTSLTRTPKEIFTAELGKFKPPPPMVTLIEKRSSNKFCEFHNDKGHITDDCVQLRKQIEESVRAGELSHFIKEIRRDRDQQKTGKRDALFKDKSANIYMIQPWQRVTRQKVTQSFAHVKEITFLPLAAHKGIGGPLVIEAKISRHAVHRIYVDGGSLMEVLYEHCFNRLRPEIKSQMVPATTSLTGFSGKTIWSPVQLRLLVTIGDAEHYTRAWMNFMIVRSPSPYNDIIGRSGIREIQAYYPDATECTTIEATPKDHAKKAEIRHENFKVAIHPDFPDQEITIGGTVSIKARTELCTLLKRNLDIFAWQPSDMTEAPERAKAIQVEVQKPIEVGIMREVYYHDWLSNPVMVKKHDGSWRMCVDFTDLNKACPQDCYPISEIDWKVKCLYGYPFKCFLDAYKCYHQIQIAKKVEEKTALHTSHGVYCYTKMPFGLKNAGATYQRLVDSQEAAQILPGASHRGHHRPYHQAGDVTSRRGRAITKMKRYARGAQYHIPTADIYERCWADTNKPRKNEVHLRAKVLVEILKEKSIQEEEGATVVEEEGPTWMTPDW
nr:hypothetical protein [Tanacetum cinerariifolium]